MNNNGFLKSILKKVNKFFLVSLRSSLTLVYNLSSERIVLNPKQFKHCNPITWYIVWHGLVQSRQIILTITSCKFCFHFFKTFIHPNLDLVNEPVRPLLFTKSRYLLNRGGVGVDSKICMKAAGVCLLNRGLLNRGLGIRTNYHPRIFYLGVN